MLNPNECQVVGPSIRNDSVWLKSVLNLGGLRKQLGQECVLRNRRKHEETVGLSHVAWLPHHVVKQSLREWRTDLLDTIYPSAFARLLAKTNLRLFSRLHVPLKRCELS